MQRLGRQRESMTLMDHTWIGIVIILILGYVAYRVVRKM
jgi:hypothetical protein